VCTMLSQEVWLSDVACVAGAEGGVVLARDGSHCHSHQTTQEVLGMVCMPVGIRDVGAYTMLVGMRAVMRWANQHLPALPLSMQVPQTNTQHMQHTLTSPALTAERCVVQIAHGLSWGSGVCVSPQGHIITARHVVAHAHARQELIRVRTSAGWHSQQQQQQQRQDGQGRGEGAELGGGAQANESWMQARVVSVSSGPWDIALLQVVDPGVAARREIKEVCLRPGELCHALDIYRGQAVCNVGFGLLSPPVAASASISRGTISKYVPGTAIVADASVYSGCSGGALLDSASGKLLGLTTMTLRINPIAKSSQESSEQQVPRVHILPKIGSVCVCVCVR
jgi:S1-C subfamily serine protease